MNRRLDSGLEPRLGDLEKLEPATRVPRHLRASAQGRNARSRPRLGAIALGLLAAVVIAAWLAQDRLRALLPEPAHTTQLAAAQAALEAGRLAGEPGAALELFQQVLSAEPDSESARAGLMAVGRALLARAEAAIARSDLAAARADFELAERILLGGHEIDAVAASLAAAEKRRVELEPLLAQGLAAYRAGRLSGANNAAAELYLRALRIDPGNALAKRGLEDVAAALGTRASAAIKAGKFQAAERNLAEIARVAPDWPGLPDLRAQLATARAAAPPATARAPTPSADDKPDPRATAAQAAPPTADVSPLLDAAEALFAAGRVDSPDDPNARALFERALALDPGNDRARRGLARIASAYLLKARMALEAGDLDGAAARIADAERAGADPNEVAEVALALREIEELRARRPTAGSGPVIDRERVEWLVARGERALERGDLIDPPGESAIDLFRSALELDRYNARARVGLDAIAPRARELFDEALWVGRLAEAERHLDALRAAGGSPAAEASMRRELAAAWLDEANRLLFDGRFEAAGRAAARARAVDPNLPGLREFELRSQDPGGRPL